MRYNDCMRCKQPTSMNSLYCETCYDLNLSDIENEYNELRKGVEGLKLDHGRGVAQIFRHIYWTNSVNKFTGEKELTERRFDELYGFTYDDYEKHDLEGFKTMCKLLKQEPIEELRNIIKNDRH